MTCSSYGKNETRLWFRSYLRRLRLPANGGGWVPVHMSINRVELDKDTYAGLVALRLPTPEETAAAGIEEPGAVSVPKKRKSKPRKTKSSKP